MRRVFFAVGTGLTASGAVLADIPSLRSIAYKYLAELFGGFSASDLTGGWSDASCLNGLCLESSLGVTVYTDRLDLVDGAASHLAGLFKQTSVAVSIEPVESFHFVGQLTPKLAA